MAYPQMNPRFSVIMPLYNKAPYVRKALESVASQTFRDFELIIVDDGSTDNSATICEEFLSALCSRLSAKIIRQANSGVAAARNNGVAASHGEFLCFLDADDWWEPNYLEEMDRLIVAYPDAGIYGMNYIYYKPGKTHVAIQNVPTGYINYPKVYRENKTMLIFTSSSSSSRKVFDEMGGFPEGIKLGEDFLLWAKITLRYPAVFCSKPLAYYNNDVPPSLRATRNLHAPKYHMLFNLQPIEVDISNIQEKAIRQDWFDLLDWLRVTGLMEFWLSDEYHNAAAMELEKVDWSKQPMKVIRMYKAPIWLLKAHRRFMQIGSFCKQKMIKKVK